jgi:hypothetical protein
MYEQVLWPFHPLSDRSLLSIFLRLPVTASAIAYTKERTEEKYEIE